MIFGMTWVFQRSRDQGGQYNTNKYTVFIQTIYKSLIIANKINMKLYCCWIVVKIKTTFHKFWGLESK